jgi:pimeloyl-ACP methyl ester carboxylesterase
MVHGRNSTSVTQAKQLLMAFALAVSLCNGCASNRYLTKRGMPENNLAGRLQLASRQGPKPSHRTLTLLRRFSLEDQFEKDPEVALATLEQPQRYTLNSERTYAVAELSYILGKRAQRQGDEPAAIVSYGRSLRASYRFLFEPECIREQNPYDPLFRGACELYNAALEDSLRLLNSEKRLIPGTNYTIRAEDRQTHIQTVLRGAWEPNAIERLEFVTDYRLQGLNNRHVSYGLGVPLIAVRGKVQTPDAHQKYYPEGLSFGVTALLRVPLEQESQPATGQSSCLVEFFDPLSANEVQLAGRWVPLQTDLSTPLAYFLDAPEYRGNRLATLGLLDPNDKRVKRGIYMLEPYDPDRIPVVMVHGLWSSPLTFMNMFNDLRSFPMIRDKYQFWFYMYPTGQPFWISATQFRADLASTWSTFDPAGQNRNLANTVLVGHSMGGLVSKMQVVDAGQDFERIVSERPIEDLKLDEEDRIKLVSAVRFQANPKINRIITIATPHRGSNAANDATRWLGRKLIQLPQAIQDTTERVARDNKDIIKDRQLLTTTTSIDSLAPDSPVFPVLLRAKVGANVKQHNIVGVLADDMLLGRITESGDGVVSYASAHLTHVESELIVPADHTTIHATPQAIFEVRRILLEHLESVEVAEKTAAMPSRTDTALR